MKKYFTFMIAMLLPVAALAQSLPGMSKDSSQPIEITADNLKVLQKDEVAVFEGKVEATQGTTKLNSDKMTVFYRAGEGADKKKKKADGQPAVSKIIVEGSVLLVNPRETAKGREGIYDVDNATVTLSGEVVLTRDQNVLKGNKLVYNMDTGKSELFGGGPTSQDGKTGRVKGMFVPNAKKN